MDGGIRNGVLTLHPHARMGILITDPKAKPRAAPADRVGDHVGRKGELWWLETCGHSDTVYSYSVREYNTAPRRL